jgi:polysaccharide deacetylase 2 family uncharacterized protein YibQ
MKAIMSYLKKKDMFFLDSVTTNKSVAEEVARQIGVKYGRRNSLFLDNEQAKSKIEEAFAAGLEQAEKDGKALLIGHVKSVALVEVIEEQYARLEKKGFVFHGLLKYFSEGKKG